MGKVAWVASFMAVCIGAVAVSATDDVATDASQLSTTNLRGTPQHSSSKPTEEIDGSSGTSTVLFEENGTTADERNSVQSTHFANSLSGDGSPVIGPIHEPVVDLGCSHVEPSVESVGVEQVAPPNVGKSSTATGRSRRLLASEDYECEHAKPPVKSSDVKNVAHDGAGDSSSPSATNAESSIATERTNDVESSDGPTIVNEPSPSENTGFANNGSESSRGQTTVIESLEDANNGKESSKETE